MMIFQDGVKRLDDSDDDEWENLNIKLDDAAEDDKENGIKI